MLPNHPFLKVCVRAKLGNEKMSQLLYGIPIDSITLRLELRRMDNARLKYAPPSFRENKKARAQNNQTAT